MIVDLLSGEIFAPSVRSYSYPNQWHSFIDTDDMNSEIDAFINSKDF